MLPDFGEIGKTGSDLSDFLDRPLVGLGGWAREDLNYFLFFSCKKNFTFRSLLLPRANLLSVESRSDNFLESCFVRCFILKGATSCDDRIVTN